MKTLPLLILSLMACALYGAEPAPCCAGSRKRALTPVPRTDGDPSWWFRRMEAKREAIAKSGGRFDVVMIGDSITHGFETRGKSVWDVFCRKRKVLNLGYSGDDTEHVLWRLTEGGELDGYRTRFFTLMIGTNNRDDSAEDVAEATRRIVGLLREKHPEAQVILMPIFPRDGLGSRLRIKNGCSAALMRDVADGRNVLWLDMHDDMVDADGGTDEKFRDHLHPNEAGFLAWRTRLEKLIPELPLAKAEKLPGWDAETFSMGAIRWDAWYGFGETDSASEEACGTLLHPAHRWRLPFFADVAADGKVTIDGRRVETLEREIDFAADGGFDYWAFLTYENGRSMNNALPYYLKAKNRSRLGFCIVLIMYRTDAWRWPDTCARWLSYLDESGYKKVCGGRELVFVYPDLVPGEYLADFRRKAKERGHDPYYVGMTFAKPAIREKVAKNCAGMDAVGAYNFVRDAEDYGRMMDFLEENQWNAAAKDGLVLVPTVNAGFDASPRRDTEVSWQKGHFKGKTYHPPLTREQLTEATRRAKRFVLSHPTTCEAKTCLWYAWNEFDEGGWLCPTRKADGTPDTMRLEAVRAALNE